MRYKRTLIILFGYFPDLTILFVRFQISTVGKLMFRYIEKCLREVNPRFQRQPFGSCSILISGDTQQLPCIADVPLIKLPPDPAKTNKSPEIIAALKEATNLYGGIKQIVILDETYRQSRENPSELSYLEFLNRLRHGTCTDADVEAVNSRTKGNVNKDELATFKNVVHIYPYRRMVRRRNR